MGSDSAFGEPFYTTRKCPKCGDDMLVNWVGEEQVEYCPLCIKEEFDKHHKEVITEQQNKKPSL